MRIVLGLEAHPADRRLFYRDVQSKTALLNSLRKDFKAQSTTKENESLNKWIQNVSKTQKTMDYWEEYANNGKNLIVHSIPSCLYTSKDRAEDWSLKHFVAFFERGVCACTEIVGLLMKQVMMVGGCTAHSDSVPFGPFIGREGLQCLVTVLKAGQDSFVMGDNKLSGAVGPLRCADTSLFMGPVVSSMLRKSNDRFLMSFLENFFNGKQAREMRAKCPESDWLSRECMDAPVGE